MHTDSTLEIFDDITADIGTEFRIFERKTCSAFDTRELPREANARRQRKAKTKGSGRASSNATAEDTADCVNSSSERRRKKFNLETYKYHSLGDYSDTIRRYGTTDSYSTEPVSILIKIYKQDVDIVNVIGIGADGARAPHAQGTIQKDRQKAVY